MAKTHSNNDPHRFDEWSKTYEHSYMQWLIFDRVQRGVLARIPTDFSPAGILDVGCGTGRLLRKLHDRWPTINLVGIDSSEGMASRARELTPSATIYLASVEHIPLESASIDLVTSTMSFHHWTEQVLGVQEIKRVLSKGGIVHPGRYQYRPRAPTFAFSSSPVIPCRRLIFTLAKQPGAIAEHYGGSQRLIIHLFMISSNSGKTGRWAVAV
jgi:ubiquinone/menaquinone biosynthesis C-methylase UbiE